LKHKLKKNMAKKVKNEDATSEVVFISSEDYVKERINAEIQKYNIADAELAKLKQKYKGVSVKSLDDKKGIALMKEGVSEMSTLRNKVEKKRAELKKESLEIGRGIDGEAKRLTEMIIEIED